MLAETDLYSGYTCTNTFKINKKAITSASVSVADITIGGNVKPVLSGVPEDYNGTVTYEYKAASSPDSGYYPLVPVSAGKYNVRATLSESDIYLEATCTAEFTINKDGFTPTLSVADITIGGTIVPVISGTPDDYNGTITYTYKPSTADDTEYSSTVPSAAGTYIVKATLSETGTYQSTSCTGTFKINKKTVTASVSAADIYVGGTISPAVTTESDGTAAFQYKLSTAPDSEYSSAVPSAAGTYTVKATISETATYLSTSCTDTFKINKNQVTASVSVDDIYVGGTPAPVIASISDGKDRASFEY